MQISVSILSALDRIECVKKLNRTTIDYYHIDVMDGIFVDNYQMPIKEIKEISKYTKKTLDIHLMVENPEEYIENLNGLEVEYITFHLEINRNIKPIIKSIKEKGYKVGLSIKPNTKINTLVPYLPYLDLILIMSVEPGYGGQLFIPETLAKISKIKKIIDDNKYNIKIEVDGGINDTNIKQLKEVGTDIVVSGSYIVKSDNYQNQINTLKIWFFSTYRIDF